MMSRGHCFLIEGEYSDKLMIFRKLAPLPRARVFTIALQLWKRQVGRPLLNKIHQTGVDIELDLYDRDAP